MPSLSLSPLYTLDEVAALTKTKKEWLYELSRRDRLPGQCRLGRQIRVSAAGVQAILAGALASQKGKA